MKRYFSLSLLVPFAFSAIGQTDNWSDVPIIENTFAENISNNGDWIVGYSDEGGTVVFNRSTQNAQYFEGIDYGRGHVVSDNGWVVGGKIVDDEPNRAIVIRNGESFTPNVFDLSVSGNIHSITPDGSRICGNVGSNDGRVEYKAFYCDIDGNGNFGELQYLPYPSRDFFGDPIQYASAIWLSEDGKTIAGQVISSRGFAVYPIIYRQQTDGSWEYSMPSESLFNINNLPLPEPVPEMDELYPDVVFPDLENYMDPYQYALYQITGGNPEDYMTAEQAIKYNQDVDKYFEVLEEYMAIFDAYMDKYWAITDDSVFFERNNMALSPNAKWLVISSEVDVFTDPANPMKYMTPYLCNLETGEWERFGETNLQYHSNQVLNDGTCLVNIISDGLIPATTYVYLPGSKEFIPFDTYISQTNPQFKDWFQEYLTSNIIVGGDPSNPDYSEEPLTVTGLGIISQDQKVIAAGVDGYTLNKNMYFSYILSDLELESGIESINDEKTFDGVYNVYNLQGVKILSTEATQDIHNLPEGLYIINGKKYLKK